MVYWYGVALFRRIDLISSKQICLYYISFQFYSIYNTSIQKLAVLKIINLYNLELDIIMHQHATQLLPPCFNTLRNPIFAIHNPFT